ncbi:MAG: TetR/AcrR family transcriptional regulator [Pseudomonadota bacterium]
MTSLREKQKARRRSEILRAARTLLEKEGFARSSMEEIAAAAEVGVATVYNYFGTKGALLAAVLGPEFDELFERGEQVVAEPPSKPATGVLGLTEIYAEIVKSWEDTDVLAAVIGPGLSAEPLLDTFTSDIESRTIEQIQRLLSAYRDRGAISTRQRVADGARVVFYIFNQHFIECVTRPEGSHRRLVRDIRPHVRFVLDAIST